MKITDVQAILISIPLRKPTSMSNKTVTAREYVVTRVRHAHIMRRQFTSIGLPCHPETRRGFWVAASLFPEEESNEDHRCPGHINLYPAAEGYVHVP